MCGHSNFPLIVIEPFLGLYDPLMEETSVCISRIETTEAVLNEN